METDSAMELNPEVGEENEEELTAQSALVALEEAWLNEKFAPEILPHQNDLVECMLQQIAHMEQNLKRLDKSDIRLMIHGMELERIKFVISSYLRARLEKIEKYTVHILSQEANRSAEECYLTAAELQYAKEFLSNMETLFKTIVLQHMPAAFQNFEINKYNVKPNMHAEVFLRANSRVEGILIPGEEAILDDEIDLEPGSQYIIEYNLVADSVKSGAVQLI